MEQDLFQTLKAYLTFWMMYSIHFNDEKSYSERKKEAQLHYQKQNKDISEIVAKIELDLNKYLNKYLMTRGVPSPHAGGVH